MNEKKVIIVWKYLNIILSFEMNTGCKRSNYFKCGYNFDSIQGVSDPMFMALRVTLPAPSIVKITHVTYRVELV